MNTQTTILALLSGLGLLAGSPARAVVFPDQIVENGHEDESPDSISRFGKGERPEKRDLSGILRPISESSFQSSGGRAPASVTAPAPSADAGPPKAAVLREQKKSKAYQEVAVIANDLGFFPSTLFVTEGLAVRLYITGASNRSQCFILDEFGIRREVKSQRVEEIVFTPSHPGRYTFNCPMNGAKGQIVVRGLDTGGRTPASE